MAWCHPIPEDSKGMSADRTMLSHLRPLPFAATGKATSFYVMRRSDVNHAVRMAAIHAVRDLKSGPS